jgi:Flp pilus assembly protein TadG
MNVRGLFRAEEGSVSIFIAVLGFAFILAAGLALDGGRKLGGLSEARELADNAARACAQGVDQATYRDTGTPTLDPADATSRAAGYLTATGNTGVITIADTTCTVTVTLSIPTRILPGPFTVSATESADAVSGVESATP